MARIKAQKLKPIILLFLLVYIIYGTCVVFGTELSQENGDGATQVTAKIQKESQTQPTTEENSPNKPDENPPLPTGEKLTLGFIFLIIAAGTMVIVVTYRGNSRQKG